MSKCTAMHAAIAPHIKPSAAVNGLCFVEGVTDMAREEENLNLKQSQGGIRAGWTVARSQTIMILAYGDPN